MILAQKKRGARSFVFQNKPVITAWASVAGKKEAEGPLSRYFDMTVNDSYFGQETWEQAEQRMQEIALEKVMEKSNLQKEDVDLVFSGDLLNQCVSSAYAIRSTEIPFLGLYGACSTMADSLLVASVFVSAGCFDSVVAMTSSHFASSERQYRFPLG